MVTLEIHLLFAIEFLVRLLNLFESNSVSKKRLFCSVQLHHKIIPKRKFVILVIHLLVGLILTAEM